MSSWDIIKPKGNAESNKKKKKKGPTEEVETGSSIQGLELTLWD